MKIADQKKESRNRFFFGVKGGELHFPEKMKNCNSNIATVLSILAKSIKDVDFGKTSLFRRKTIEIDFSYLEPIYSEETICRNDDILYILSHWNKGFKHKKISFNILFLDSYGHVVGERDLKNVKLKKFWIKKLSFSKKRGIVVSSLFSYY